MQINGGTVASQNDALSVAEEVVEHVEERVLRAFSRDPLLHIVNDEQVNGLVELDEIIDGVLPGGIDILHLEQAGTDVEHALLRIELLRAVANGID